MTAMAIGNYNAISYANYSTALYGIQKASRIGVEGTQTSESGEAVYEPDYDRLEISEEGKRSEQSDAAGEKIVNPGESDEKKPGRKSSPAECETCKERKYQDGSDEMVSYKSPTHIDPSAAPARVAAHENEHVSNAYDKAEKNNGKVLSVSVSIHTAVCPECGRTYVSGGETRSTISYNKGGQESDGENALGANLDLIA